MAELQGGRRNRGHHLDDHVGDVFLLATPDTGEFFGAMTDSVKSTRLRCSPAIANAVSKLV